MRDCRVIEGDCLAVLPTLESGSVDAVVTSPPYNLGASPHSSRTPRKCRVGEVLPHGDQRRRWEWGGYSENQDALPEAEYQAHQLRALTELHRVCRDGASLFYVHKDRTWKGVSLSPRSWLDRSPFTVRQQIVWDRTGGIEHSGAYFYPVNEWVFWLTKGKPTNRLESCAAWSSIWRIPPCANTGHPAAFPIGLARRCVLASCESGGLILDPFAGSGTTGLAALREGRRAILIEREPAYVEIIRRRLAEEEAKAPLFASGE